jgi:polyhydroxybutyrate depolymerase
LIGPLFVFVVALLVVLWLLWRPRRPVRWLTINVNGLERRYFLCSADPSARHQPLLLCFHGGLGRVELLVRSSGIAEVGLRHGYTVIFPEAKDGWIDSRPERGGSTRDLDFVDALLDSLVSNNLVDPSRMFALGISNGGLFLYRMAGERPLRFAGLATALANMPIAERSAGTGAPIPITMIFGRQDRIQPWEGGRIMRSAQLGVGGEVVSAEATLRFWLKRNLAEGTPQKQRLVSAGRPIDVEDYPAAPDGAPVRYVTVGNWGHRWPCWGNALSASADDFNAANLVMEFFSGLGLSDKNVPTFSTAAEGDARA